MNELAKEHLEAHRGEIFRDVWASFSGIDGYVSQPTLLHAYGFGVPQNRPRVMILGIRTDVFSKWNVEPAIFDPDDTSQSYASQLRNNGGFFPTWDEDNIDAPDLIDVLSDLNFHGWTEKNCFHQKSAESDFQKLMRDGVQTDDEGRETSPTICFQTTRKKLSRNSSTCSNITLRSNLNCQRKCVRRNSIKNHCPQGGRPNQP